MLRIYYRVSDGLVLLEHGLLVAGQPTGALAYTADAAAYGAADVDAAHLPHAREWRVSAGALRRATDQEIAAFDAAVLAARSHGASRNPDRLADAAMFVRARIGINAWNAMTPAQKVAATVAEADVWKSIREFIDDKVAAGD